MNSTIILASYVNCHEKDENGERYPIKIENQNGILENISKNLPHKQRMVFVANDKDDFQENDNRAKVLFESLKMSGVGFRNFVVLDERNKDEAGEIIRNAGLVILSGGKVSRQNKFFNEIGLAEAIEKTPAVVLGISAGAMNLCNNIYNFPEELEDVGEPMHLKGMGFFDKRIIPHFDTKRMQYEPSSDGLDVVNDYIIPFSNKQELVCLDNEAYIMLQDGHMQTFGNCYLLSDGKKEPFGIGINLKMENINGEEFVNLNGRYYSIQEDFRGVGEKFWMILDGNKKINYEEPFDTTHKLFKFNRQEDSCEDWGEILACQIAKRINMKCVEYCIANLADEDGNKIGHGVICNSYKKHKDEVEFTAFNLQSNYTNFVYDNFCGQSVKGANTVNGIIEAIYHSFEGKLARKEVVEIRNDLIKQAIFDFLLAQADRHWYNTTILARQENDTVHVRMANAYDNGCISFLKRVKDVLEGMSKGIGKKGKDSEFLHQELERYSPMLGIKTSLVKIDYVNGDGVVRVKPVNASPEFNPQEIFLQEIAQEIIYNPEIATFYILARDMIRSNERQGGCDCFIDDIVKELERSNQTPPPYVLKIINDVLGHQLDVLEKHVNIALAQVQETKEQGGRE